MNEQPVTEALIHQMGQAFAMLREVMKQVSDDAWNRGPAPSRTLGRLATHAVETAEFYAGGRSDGFPWGRHGDWEDMECEIDRREDLLAYADRVEDKVRLWLHGLSDEGLKGPDEGFAWFPTILGRAVYSLRHLQHTIGELNAMLKAAELCPAAWR